MNEAYIYNDTRMRGFTYSGYNLIEEVNSLFPQKVIDVGCGENLFKDKIHNLIGFDADPYPNSDMQASVNDAVFEKESIDIALCLGSIQYKPVENQFYDVEKIVSWIKPGGYIVVRMQPFLDYIGHNEDHISNFGTKHRLSYKTFYEWTNKLNLSVCKPIVLDINKNFPTVERLVWWWKK